MNNKAKNQEILQIKNLYHIYKVNKLFRSIVVLKGISLTLKFNQILCIIGPSGSGKSTLLKIIAGILIPTSGNFIVLGEKFSNRRKLIRKLSSLTSYVPQEPIISLIPSLTVKENLFNLPALSSKYFNSLSISEKSKEIEKATNELKINNLLNRKITEISTGEVQRVAIAIALLKKTPILLFDEPSAFLPPDIQKDFGNLILDLIKNYKVGIIFVTHSLELSKMFKDPIELFNGYFRKIGSIKTNDKEEISFERIIVDDSRIIIPNSYFKNFKEKKSVRLIDSDDRIEIKDDLFDCE